MVDRCQAFPVKARATTRLRDCRFTFELHHDHFQQTHKLYRTMAEPTANGTPPANGDIEMKEEQPAEVRALLSRSHPLLTTSQTPLNTIQQADPTDPNPPPQRWTEQSLQPHGPPDHLASIAPGVATPPTGATTRPGSMPPQPSARPEKPVAHGGPTRQYLNTNVTPHLLEGMKYLAVYEPEKPLEWLSNFLKERSKEVEG